MSHASRAQLLRLRRKSQVSVELACNEQLQRFRGGIEDDREVLFRVEPPTQEANIEIKGSKPPAPTLFPFRSAIERMPPWANSS